MQASTNIVGVQETLRSMITEQVAESIYQEAVSIKGQLETLGSRADAYNPMGPGQASGNFFGRRVTVGPVYKQPQSLDQHIQARDYLLENLKTLQQSLANATEKLSVVVTCQKDTTNWILRRAQQAITSANDLSKTVSEKIISYQGFVGIEEMSEMSRSMHRMRGGIGRSVAFEWSTY